jgi:hypothetical protein
MPACGAVRGMAQGRTLGPKFERIRMSRLLMPCRTTRRKWFRTCNFPALSGSFRGGWGINARYCAVVRAADTITAHMRHGGAFDAACCWVVAARALDQLHGARCTLPLHRFLSHVICCLGGKQQPGMRHRLSVAWARYGTAHPKLAQGSGAASRCSVRSRSAGTPAAPQGPGHCRARRHLTPRG